MDNSRDRNPSPPPELLEHDEDFVPDRIGGSMYSKRWLYKTLMKMLKVVEEHDVEKETGVSSSKSVVKETENIFLKSENANDSSQNIVELDKKIEEDACTLVTANSVVEEHDVEKETEASSSKSVVKETENSLNKSEDANDSSQNIVELDKKIEEDACTLWDMSANSEIAKFLCGCNVADIFLTIIENTKSPRLLEIVVGILGNMSSFDSACKYISRNVHLVKAVIMLTGCSDSCTLVQVFRLLSCGVANRKSREKWYYAFTKDSTFLSNLKNILQNNLCHDVLQGVLKFLNYILNYDSRYCKQWTEESYFMAIIESGKQLIKCNKYEDLDSFWAVLCSIDDDNTETLTIPVYVDHFLDLKPLFTAYILKVGEEETLPPAARHRTIANVYSLFANLRIKTDDIYSRVLENDVLRAMTHTYKLFDSFLQKHARKNECNTFDEETGNITSSITQTGERNGDNKSPETEESVSVMDEINAEDARDYISFCATTCPDTLKDAESIQILGEIINLNIMRVVIVGASQSES